MMERQTTLHLAASPACFGNDTGILEECLERLVHERALTHILLDVSRVNVLDGSALRRLVELRERLLACSADLLLWNAPASLRRLLEFMRLDGYLLAPAR